MPGGHWTAHLTGSAKESRLTAAGLPQSYSRHHIARPRRPANGIRHPNHSMDPAGSLEFARFFVLHPARSAYMFARVRMAASPTSSASKCLVAARCAAGSDPAAVRLAAARALSPRSVAEKAPAATVTMISTGAILNSWLTELNDMVRVDSDCHPKEPVKIAEDWAQPSTASSAATFSEPRLSHPPSRDPPSRVSPNLGVEWSRSESNPCNEAPQCIVASAI